MLSNHYKEVYDEINKIEIDSKDVFDLVHDYLIYSGFVGTLHAFEDESSFALIQKEDCEVEDNLNKINTLLNKSTFATPRKNTLGPDMNVPLSARGKQTQPNLLNNSGVKQENEKQLEFPEELKEETHQEEDKGNAAVEETKEPCKIPTTKAVGIATQITPILEEPVSSNSIAADAEKINAIQETVHNTEGNDKDMQAEQTLPHSQTVEETAAKEDVKMSEEAPTNKEEVQHENIATPAPVEKQPQKENDEEEMIDTTTKNKPQDAVMKDAHIEPPKMHRPSLDDSEIMRSSLHDMDKSEISEPYEIDPFF
mmetsp:Transcript_5239/g.6220  ORF Transcript_5239/g.6220 Transcript_5239/m.6220 type:complete len:311 (-) Transcript_5239:682-1614(-)